MSFIGTPQLTAGAVQLVASWHNASGFNLDPSDQAGDTGRHVAKRELGVVRAALTSPHHDARAKLPGRYNL
jgi:hypothetical protein